jgi:hypothetical protein
LRNENAQFGRRERLPIPAPRRAQASFPEETRGFDFETKRHIFDRNDHFYGKVDQFWVKVSSSIEACDLCGYAIPVAHPPCFTIP